MVLVSEVDETNVAERNLIAMSERLFCNRHAVHKRAVVALEVDDVKPVNSSIRADKAMTTRNGRIVK